MIQDINKNKKISGLAVPPMWLPDGVTILEFQIQDYLKLKYLNFKFSQIRISYMRLTEIKISEF